MIFSGVVIGLVVLGTVVGLLLLRHKLAASRQKSREFDAADLAGLRAYATGRGLTVVQGTDKHAFLATGELQGLQISLSTSDLEFVMRGRTVVGPIETHMRVRGMPADTRALVGRPISAVAGNQSVEDPLTRGVDQMPTGDAAFDDSFRCYATTPEALDHWLDATSRKQLESLAQAREVRLSEGELSISLVPQGYVGGEPDDSPWNHVRPVVKDPAVLDAAAKLLARIHANSVG